MKPSAQLITGSPFMARVAPFVIFLVLTACQGQFGEASRYWFYFAKTIVGIWLILVMRPVVTEMKWAISWESVVVGVGVFALWVGLDGLYPSIVELLQKIGIGDGEAESRPWNPHVQFGDNAALAWLFIFTRFFAVTLVVPPLEEVFYRSFVYRWIVRPEFDSVRLNQFHPKAFFLTSAIFGLVHLEWLPGILCGMAYQWLVIGKNRLGDAMTAHAITNFLLAVWVVWKGAWHFW